MSMDYDFDNMKNSEKIKESNKRLDSFIGDKVRQLRISLGMSQDKLASFLGVTFQQVQKYEKGVNRISASMLYNIATVLNVKIQWFVEGFDGGRSTTVQEDGKSIYGINAIDCRESQNLLKIYYGIDDINVREKVLDLIKTFSASVETEKGSNTELHVIDKGNNCEAIKEGKLQEQKRIAKLFKKRFKKTKKQS